MEQQRQGGDAEHGEKGGDERHSGDHRCVLLILQAEDGAIGGYGHGNHQRVDIDYQRRET